MIDALIYGSSTLSKLDGSGKSVGLFKTIISSGFIDEEKLELVVGVTDRC